MKRKSETVSRNRKSPIEVREVTPKNHLWKVNVVIKIKGSNTELFEDLEEGKPIQNTQSGK